MRLGMGVGPSGAESPFLRKGERELGQTRHVHELHQFGHHAHVRRQPMLSQSGNSDELVGVVYHQTAAGDRQVLVPIDGLHRGNESVIEVVVNPATHSAARSAVDGSQKLTASRCEFSKTPMFWCAHLEAYSPLRPC
jgi:hypothetical protein